MAYHPYHFVGEVLLHSVYMYICAFAQFLWWCNKACNFSNIFNNSIHANLPNIYPLLQLNHWWYEVHMRSTYYYDIHVLEYWKIQNLTLQNFKFYVEWPYYDATQQNL